MRLLPYVTGQNVFHLFTETKARVEHHPQRGLELLHTGLQAGGYCCVAIAGDLASNVCEEPCHDDSQCGGAHCAMLTSGTCSGASGVCE